MSKKIVFLGFPGSGKGTQSAMLAEKCGCFVLSTGDAFREMIAHGKGDVADQVRALVSKGELVSDDLTFSVVKEALASHKDSWILDGFPRNLPQAELLKTYDSPSDVVLFDMDEEKIFQRLSGRRLAKGSGKMYNIYTNPPKKEGICDVSGEALIQRDDDKPEAVTKRMEVYHKQTAPLIRFYEDAGLLRKVNADQDMNAVFSDVKKVLGL